MENTPLPFDQQEVDEIQAALEAFAMEQSEKDAAELAAVKALSTIPEERVDENATVEAKYQSLLERFDKVESKVCFIVLVWCES